MHYLVVATISPGAHGTSAINLGRILRSLAGLGAIKTFDPPNEPGSERLAFLSHEVDREIGAAVFGPAMRALVQFFQLQSGLGDAYGGVVEAKTADLLNGTLRQLNLPLSPESLPDLRLVEHFAVLFHGPSKVFRIRYRLAGEAEVLHLSVSPTVLSALLGARNSASHFAYDVNAKTFVATDDLLP
jgi:hypothetical protein